MCHHVLETLEEIAVLNNGAVNQELTLRDQFAMSAMIGFASIIDLSFKQIAEYSYKQADAMLEARENNNA